MHTNRLGGQAQKGQQCLEAAHPPLTQVGLSLPPPSLRCKIPNLAETCEILVVQ
jgi:hypothetical protein